MGMYTEIFVSGNIPIGRDAIAEAVLHYLFDPEIGEMPTTLPDHPFFAKPRWPFIGSSSSYYFQPRSQRDIWADDISKELHFVSRSDLKNYDNEIEAFFDWLRTTGAEFFGYARYEEAPLALKLYSDEATEA